MAGVTCSNHVRPTTNLRTNSKNLRISSNDNNKRDWQKEVFWDNFKQYLKSLNSRSTVNDRINYAKKYYHVIVNNDASDILPLALDKRIHVMKALTALSKFSGCYDSWKNMIDKYDLKWSTGDALTGFQHIINETNYDVMIRWANGVISKLRLSYSNIIVYNILTGLRPNEACQSVGLIRRDSNCVNVDKSMLEHFRYPEIFIRRIKKAYISIVTDLVLDVPKHCGSHSYYALKLMMRRNDMRMNMTYCKKIFARYLRNQGIESETIDLLQGRIPKSVFVRHYFRPDFNHNKIKDAIDSLYDTLAV